MAYQALYRVFRSQRFDAIVGQRAITQTLKNAIVQEQISHAYLFTGPRGTGKTSAAKIFAKAINCPNSVDGEPCNECDMCLSITNGSQEDVIEIDAASNNGVEEIRFIRDRANYAPTQATYKVYIIDEVHMLSTGAFNALLKTLEEPKKNVIFILATTEPHKIPATIISRTQRFDFKRIQVADIVEHLADVLQEMAVEYEPNALTIIARAAEGGMRDALSILDQAIAFSEGQITETTALDVTGSLTNERMDHFLQACVDQQVSDALMQLQGMLEDGKEASRLLENLLFYCRDLLLYQQAPALLEQEGKQISEGFQHLASEVQVEQLYQFITILNETQQEIRFTTSPGIYLEVATVKLATPAAQAVTTIADSAAPDSQQIKVLQQEITELRQQIKHLHVQPKETAKPKNQVRQVASTYRVPRERVNQVLKNATKERMLQVKKIWEDLLDSLSPTQKAMLRASEPKAASDMGIVIAFDYEIICQRATSDPEFSLALHNHMSRFIENYAPESIFITQEDWPSLRNDFLAGNQGDGTLEVEESDNQEVSLLPETEDLVVTKAQELFGDLIKIEEN